MWTDGVDEAFLWDKWNISMEPEKHFSVKNGKASEPRNRVSANSYKNKSAQMKIIATK